MNTDFKFTTIILAGISDTLMVLLSVVLVTSLLNIDANVYRHVSSDSQVGTEVYAFFFAVVALIIYQALVVVNFFSDVDLRDYMSVNLYLLPIPVGLFVIGWSFFNAGPFVYIGIVLILLGFTTYFHLRFSSYVEEQSMGV